MKTATAVSVPTCDAKSSMEMSLRGEALFLSVHSKFSCVVDKYNRIQVDKLAEAALTIEPVYDAIFSSGMIASRLKNDIQNSTGNVLNAYRENPVKRLYIEGFIEDEIRTIGDLNKIRKDLKTGVRNLLWMKRALDFVFTFLEKIIINGNDKNSTTLAKQVYGDILEPYHGFCVGNIVRIALSFCPTREGLIKSLGFSMQDNIEEKVIELLSIIRPILIECSAQLEKANCNFPDKA